LLESCCRSSERRGKGKKKGGGGEGLCGTGGVDPGAVGVNASESVVSVTGYLREKRESFASNTPYTSRPTPGVVRDRTDILFLFVPEGKRKKGGEKRETTRSVGLSVPVVASSVVG